MPIGGRCSGLGAFVAAELILLLFGWNAFRPAGCRTGGIFG
jgi:hypothetical protein